MSSQDIGAALAKVNRKVLSREGVTGTAVGLHRGQPCIKVYVENDRVDAGLKDSVDGFPVVVETTGRLETR